MLTIENIRDGKRTKMSQEVWDMAVKKGLDQGHKVVDEKTSPTKPAKVAELKDTNEDFNKQKPKD